MQRRTGSSTVHCVERHRWCVHSDAPTTDTLANIDAHTPTDEEAICLPYLAFASTHDDVKSVNFILGDGKLLVLLPQRRSRCLYDGLLSVNLVTLKGVREHAFNWLAVECISHTSNGIRDGVGLGAWTEHSEAHLGSLVGSHDGIGSTAGGIAADNKGGGARCNEAVKVHREVTGTFGDGGREGR